MKAYEALARAFVAEGTKTLFTLMGDATMYWQTAMAQLGVDVVTVRHESAGIAMATGFSRANTDVGVAAVTSGPGLTQIATPLMVASRARTPLVIFAGDTATNDMGAPQKFDQRRFIEASGGLYQPLQNGETAADDVRRAFEMARTESRPVVLNAPKDLQRQDFPWEWNYTSSVDLLPAQQPMQPDPRALAGACDLIRASRFPVIVGGRGAMDAECRDEILALAFRIGALVATTLPAKGWLDKDDYCVGISGAFSSAVAEELFVEADLVIGIGASFNYYTTEGRLLFPKAAYLLIDRAPKLPDGASPADCYLTADAKLGVGAILDVLVSEDRASIGFRTSETMKKFSVQPSATSNKNHVATSTAAGTVDPREVVNVVAKGIGPDAFVVTGVGHYWGFPVMHMNASLRGFISHHEFLAIGQCLSVAIGVAMSDPHHPVIAFEGDASFMMQLPELDTAARLGVSLFVVVFNDGALGAELHALEAEGFEELSGSIVPVPSLDVVARSLGWEARVAHSMADIDQAIGEFNKANDQPYLVDARIDRSDLSELILRLRFGEVNLGPHQGSRERQE
jgi:acetolactate synthase I/II/III large subunit